MNTSKIEIIDLYETYRYILNNIINLRIDDIIKNSFPSEKVIKGIINDYDWNIFKNKSIILDLDSKYIIPSWLYMAIAIKIYKYTNFFYIKNINNCIDDIIYDHIINNMDVNKYKDKTICLKGCDKTPIAYKIKILKKILPISKKILFGEPCSGINLNIYR